MTDQNQAPDASTENVMKMADAVWFATPEAGMKETAQMLRTLAKQRDELAVENERLRQRVAELEKYQRVADHAVSDQLNRALKAEAERDQALAASAAREIAMRDRAAYKSTEGWRDGYDPTPHIRALPLSPDGQQALDNVRVKEWQDGYVKGADDALRKKESKNPHRQPSRSSDSGKSEDRG